MSLLHLLIANSVNNKNDIFKTDIFKDLALAENLLYSSSFFGLKIGAINGIHLLWANSVTKIVNLIKQTCDNSHVLPLNICYKRTLW